MDESARACHGGGCLLLINHVPFELLTLLERHADVETPAILAPGRLPLSHAGLSSEVSRIHRFLRETGIESGARIALVLPNGPEAAVATLAVASHTACIPLNPAYRMAELRAHLVATRADTVMHATGDPGPVAALAGELGLRTIALTADPAMPAGSLRASVVSGGSVTPQVAHGEPGETALILHTSGTTAQPKIVPLSQANLAAASQNIAAHLRLGQQDRALNMMPLFHVHGFVGSLLASLASGGGVICTPGFDGDAFGTWIEALDPTWYTAAPTLHQAILGLGESGRPLPPHRLRFVRSASSAMPLRLIVAIEKMLGVPVIEAYGTTEASSPIASNPLPPAARKVGSVGLPAGVQVAIADEEGKHLETGATGEIVIRGPGVMKGYESSNPKTHAESFWNDWFRTGDVGRFDEDGYLYVQGRIKEIINRGGEKVSPREVDEALQALPEVLEAAAFPVPHPTLGEDLDALVVLRAGAATDTAALRLRLRSQLADFKLPSRLHLVSSIPRNASGKVRRAGLHEWLDSNGPATSESAVSDTGLWLLAACRDTLKVDGLDSDDNFFTAGGDSLRAAGIAGRINAHFKLALPATTFFDLPIIRDLAARIDQERQALAASEANLLSEIDELSDEEVQRLLDAQEPDHRHHYSSIGLADD